MRLYDDRELVDIVTEAKKLQAEAREITLMIHLKKSFKAGWKKGSQGWLPDFLDCPDGVDEHEFYRGAEEAFKRCCFKQLSMF